MYEQCFRCDVSECSVCHFNGASRVAYAAPTFLAQAQASNSLVYNVSQVHVGKMYSVMSYLYMFLICHPAALLFLLDETKLLIPLTRRPLGTTVVDHLKVTLVQVYESMLMTLNGIAG